MTAISHNTDYARKSLWHQRLIANVRDALAGSPTVCCGTFVLNHRPHKLLSFLRWLFDASHRRAVKAYLNDVARIANAHGKHERARMAAELAIFGRAEIRAPAPDAR